MRTGRPTKYDEAMHPAWGQSLAMEGKTDEEIAASLGISRATLYEWKNVYPDFSDAIKMGKEPANAAVEAALFKRAIGYTVKEKQIIVEMDKEGNQKPARIVTTDKTIAGDVTAMIYYLKNRVPAKWRDKTEVETTERVITGFTFEDLE